MTKKSNSKAMTQILERLCMFDYINVVIFPEETILEEPVESWPLCDCLISFHSKGKDPCLSIEIRSPDVSENAVETQTEHSVMISHNVHDDY
jgi:hypothetical protein